MIYSSIQTQDSLILLLEEGPYVAALCLLIPYYPHPGCLPTPIPTTGKLARRRRKTAKKLVEGMKRAGEIASVAEAPNPSELQWNTRTGISLLS